MDGYSEAPNSVCVDDLGEVWPDIIDVDSDGDITDSALDLQHLHCASLDEAKFLRPDGVELPGICPCAGSGRCLNCQRGNIHRAAYSCNSDTVDRLARLFRGLKEEGGKLMNTSRVGLIDDVPVFLRNV